MADDLRRPGGHVRLLKRGLLLAWAAWFSVVFATNLCDALKALRVLPADWAFASGNFAFVSATTARYGPPGWLNGLLFAGVVAWEGLAAALFWRAGLRYQGEGGDARVYAAFGCGLALWAAFVLADEVFVAYTVEAAHWRLFVAQLGTLLAVELLPER